MVLKGSGPIALQTHSYGDWDAVRKTIVRFERGFEQGPPGLAFLDRGGSGENQYHARLGDAGKIELSSTSSDVDQNSRFSTPLLAAINLHGDTDGKPPRRAPES